MKWTIMIEYVILKIIPSQKNLMILKMVENILEK